MNEDKSDVRITVRELQRNASSVLNQIEHGETVSITRHGKVIARMTPPDPAEDAVSAAIDAGILDAAVLTRARTAAQTARMPREAATRNDDEPTLSQVLADLRDEEADR